MIYLCVNGNKCCILDTYLHFNELKEFLAKNKHKSYPIPGKFSSTDWGGCDDIDRTLKLYNLRLTADYIKYEGVYEGTDYDHGHSYDFKFKFNRIIRAGR